MSIVEKFDHPERKQDKEHFRHLIEVALADGTIDEDELKMLHRMGRNLGITEPEINSLMEATKNSGYNPPYELSRRFSQLYGIIKVVLADGKIENSEMRMATNIGLRSGFSETEVPILLSLLIDGIRNEEDEEDLFMQYKKRIMSK